MKTSLMGAVSLVLIMAACNPAHAVDAVCVAPDQIQSLDQEALDQSQNFNGYKAAIVGRIAGDSAKSAGAMLVGLGAPAELAEADVILILTAEPPEGREAMSNRHIVAFKEGCKIGGGFVPQEIAEALLGKSA